MISSKGMSFVMVSGLVMSPLPTLAKAPPDRYTVSASTVRDNKTQLLWQRSHSAPQTMTWDAAKTYCTQQGTGWRLPTIKELQTLVDYSKDKYLYDDSAFSFSNEEPILWSSTENIDIAGPGAPRNYAFLVAFGFGHTVTYEKTTPELVLCVQ